MVFRIVVISIFQIIFTLGILTLIFRAIPSDGSSLLGVLLLAISVVGWSLWIVLPVQSVDPTSERVRRWFSRLVAWPFWLLALLQGAWIGLSASHPLVVVALYSLIYSLFFSLLGRRINHGETAMKMGGAKETLFLIAKLLVGVLIGISVKMGLGL